MLVRLAKGVGLPIPSVFVSCVVAGIWFALVVKARIPEEQDLSGYAVIGNVDQGSPGIELDQPSIAVNDWRISRGKIDIVGLLGARMEPRLCFRIRSNAVRCAVGIGRNHRTAVVTWTWGVYHRMHQYALVEIRMATVVEESLLRLAAYSFALVGC